MSQTAFPKVLVINKSDNVGVALEDLRKGQVITFGDECFPLLTDVGFGHKFAVREVADASYIVKYGAKVGIATQPIKVGEHVHVHNVRDIVDDIRRMGREVPKRMTL